MRILRQPGMPPERRTLRSLDALQAEGLSGFGDDGEVARVADRYAIALTPHLLDQIDRADPERDPIARQFVPDGRELEETSFERADPIGDHAHEPVPGLVHRHRDRVLLKIVSVCPVYCRFCFRREMVGPGKEQGLGPDQLDVALDYIERHPEIWEVILTGGDPFMLSGRRAEAVTRRIEAIDHVKVVRWHTRMPVADPERITPGFVASIRSRSKSVFVAVHVNHVRELTAEARAACARMADAGIALVSQSVLLKGVNDSIEALSDLMRGLVEARIKPYYLHHLDAAPGTSHFRVTVDRGRELVRQLRAEVSGLAQPTYVIDIPGGVSKAVAALSDVETRDGGVQVRGADDVWRAYSEK
ncbi:MAG: lysine-2,3-aminomutase-like protein [Hyphomonadaceae bacterium]